jgi:outer membrane protein assembly factor BamB
MASDESLFPADTVISGQDLLAWRSRHPLLPGDVRPGGPLTSSGPVLTDDTVIAWSSRPSLLWAHWKTNGQVAWTQSLENIAGVTSSDRCVYVLSHGRIHCLEGSTGKPLWQTPAWRSPLASDDGFQVVRRPSIAGGRLFWPSAGGLVSCAESSSGERIWSTRLPEAVVSALLVLGGYVIGMESPSAIFALDANDGRLIWKRTLPTGSGMRPVSALDGVVVRLDDQLLLLRPADGSVMATWSWPEHLTGHVTGGKTSAFAVRGERQASMVLGRHTVIPTNCKILRLGEHGSILWELESARYGPRLVCDEARNRLVEACGGLAIVDPVTGRRRFLIRLPDTELLLAPAIDGDRLYATTLPGEVIALRSPA